MILGQDSNNQTCVVDEIEEGESRDANIGSLGLKKADVKGIQLIDFNCHNNFVVGISIFKAKSHDTHKTFNKKKTTHHIDHMIVSDGLNKIVENCQVDGENGVHSDYQASCMLLRLRAPKIYQNKNIKST